MGSKRTVPPVDVRIPIEVLIEAHRHALATGRPWIPQEEVEPQHTLYAEPTMGDRFRLFVSDEAALESSWTWTELAKVMGAPRQELREQLGLPAWDDSELIHERSRRELVANHELSLWCAARLLRDAATYEPFLHYETTAERMEARRYVVGLCMTTEGDAFGLPVPMASSAEAITCFNWAQWKAKRPTRIVLTD